MAEMLIDGAKLAACNTAEADAIRAKTGGTSPIPYDFANSKGFADAIAAIPSGGQITKDEWTMVSKFTGTALDLYNTYVDTTFEGVQLLSLADGGTTKNDFVYAMIWIFDNGGTLKRGIAFRYATGGYSDVSSGYSAWMEVGSTLTRYKIPATIPA